VILMLLGRVSDRRWRVCRPEREARMVDSQAWAFFLRVRSHRIFKCSEKVLCLIMEASCVTLSSFEASLTYVQHVYPFASGDERSTALNPITDSN
jgi:hypothetical protein